MSTIDPVGYSPTTSATQTTAKKTENGAAGTAATASTNESEAAVLEKGVEEKKATYSKPKMMKPDMSKVNSLKAGYNKTLDAFQAMVETLISKQGNMASFNGIDLSSTKGILKLKSQIENGMPVDQGTINSAQAAIGADGEFGVEKTSERLFQFALAVSGGDKSQFETLKNAIDKGFDQARKAWGGKLPEISDRTYEATMKKLEAWKNS